MTCEGVDIIDQSLKPTVKQFLQQAADFYRDELSIERETRIQLSSAQPLCGSYGGFYIPQIYFSGTYTSSDLVVFVTSWTTPSKQSSAAWAIACRFNAINRPIMGQINLLPYQMSARPTYGSVVLHELTHVLGMGSQFHDKLWNVELKRVRTRFETIGSDTLFGKPVIKLILPRVIKAVQEHFDCQLVNGVELDDGSDNSHFEPRVLRDDLMANFNGDTRSGRYSEVTRAYLLDTGWYSASSVPAAQMVWGFKKGCGFLSGKCSTDAAWRGDYAVCADDSAAAHYCSHTGVAGAFCSLRTYPTCIPTWGQNVAGSCFKGGVVADDYCPLVRPTGARTRVRRRRRREFA